MYNIFFQFDFILVQKAEITAFFVFLHFFRLTFPVESDTIAIVKEINKKNKRTKDCNRTLQVLRRRTYDFIHHSCICYSTWFVGKCLQNVQTFHKEVMDRTGN